MAEDKRNPKVVYNLHLKIKGITPYLIFLIKESLSLIESMDMNMYLTYKNKLNNMDNIRMSNLS